MRWSLRFCVLLLPPLWAAHAAAEVPPPHPLGPGPQAAVSARGSYAASEAGPVSAQRLRVDAVGTAAVGCDSSWPTCLAVSVGLGADVNRLALSDPTFSDTQHHFAGLSVGIAAWPLRRTASGATVEIGLVGRAADLGRSDDAGGLLGAGLELRVGARQLRAALRVEELRRAPRGGFDAAWGTAVRSHVSLCGHGCLELGTAVVAMGREAAAEARIGLSGHERWGARIWLAREFSLAGPTTLGVQWVW